MINNALEKAKHATDAANERSAKAEILIQYLADGGTAIEKDTDYYYDAVKGSLSKTEPTVSYGKHGDHDIIKVQISEDGEVTVSWKTNTKGLCSEKALPDHTA